MSAAPQLKYLTPEEYLAIERRAEFKSEYIDGVMYPLFGTHAMAGGNPTHNLVSGNVHSLINMKLWDGPCRVFNSDQRVRVPSKRKYLYPDVTVVCEKPQFAEDEKDVLLNPLLIIEVLSDSTAGYDRVRKFLYYQEIESFHEYLLVAQDAPIILHYIKQPDSSWLCIRLEGLDQTLTLSTINCQFALKDIYAKVLS